MKDNCFVRFAIEGEEGVEYGIYNPEANIVMCACCGGVYSPDDGITILETMEIGLEAYDAIIDAFAEYHLCNTCAHITQENTNDVACCNCCENYSFFSPVEGT